MIDFSSTLSFCGLDFFSIKKTHFASQTSMKQHRPSTWKHYALCEACKLNETSFVKPGFTLKDQNYLHQLATNKFDGFASNYPISIIQFP